MIFLKRLFAASLLLAAVLDFSAPLSAMNRKLFLSSPKNSSTDTEVSRIGWEEIEDVLASSFQEEELINLKESVSNGQNIGEAVNLARELCESKFIWVQRAVLDLLQELIKKEQVQNDVALYDLVRCAVNKLRQSEDAGIQSESSILYKEILLAKFKALELAKMSGFVCRGIKTLEAVKMAHELCESKFMVVQQELVALVQKLVPILEVPEKLIEIRPAIYIYIESMAKKLCESEYPFVRGSARQVLQNILVLKQNHHKLLQIMQRVEKFLEMPSGGLLNLKGLNLDSHEISAIFRDLGPRNCAQIRELWLNNNGLTELSPEIFSDLLKLQVLDLAGNKLTQKVKDALEEKLPGVFLYFMGERR